MFDPRAGSATATAAAVAAAANALVSLPAEAISSALGVTVEAASPQVTVGRASVPLVVAPPPPASPALSDISAMETNPVVVVGVSLGGVALALVIVALAVVAWCWCHKRHVHDRASALFSSIVQIERQSSEHAVPAAPKDAPPPMEMVSMVHHDLEVEKI